MFRTFVCSVRYRIYVCFVRLMTLFWLTVFVTVVPCFLGMYDFNYISNFYVISDSSFHIVKILDILYKANKSGLVWGYVCLFIGSSVRPSIFDMILMTTVSRVFMKFCIGVPCKEVSSKCEFHENQLSDSHSFVKAIDKLLPVLSILLNRFGLNAV
jgi:hypothetical protein